MSGLVGCCRKRTAAFGAFLPFQNVGSDDGSIANIGRPAFSRAGEYRAGCGHRSHEKNVIQVFTGRPLNYWIPPMGIIRYRLQRQWRA